jgi:hypothetical protein
LPHKADKSFFDRKRPWSERKDQILACYLEPYLAKVARRRQPILIVDGFAGPGKFGDGKIGSPLIICGKAQGLVARGVAVSVLCIESEPEVYELLCTNLSGFSFAEPAPGTFLDHIPKIRDLARTHTTFLYVDPWTVEGLEWAALDSVFSEVMRAGGSVELLLNFNAPSFVRRALAALKCDVPLIDPDIEDAEEYDLGPVLSPSSEHLTRIVGGSWWEDVLASSTDFREQVRRVAEEVCNMLRLQFTEVGRLAIKAKPAHRVPKYYLLFASGHPDGLRLMNDAMVRTRGTSMFYLDLFARSDLDRLILDVAEGWIPRGELILAIIRQAFCMFSRSEIRSAVEDLLKSHALTSSTGKTRINDTVKVRRAR